MAAKKKSVSSQSKGVAGLVKSILKRKSSKKTQKSGIEKNGLDKNIPEKKRVKSVKTLQKNSSPKNGVVMAKSRISPDVGLTESLKNSAASPKSFTLSKPTDSPKYVFNADIPENYNETYMCAIPRDPLWAFVYWEISGITQKGLCKTYSNETYQTAKRILRVVDISDIVYDGNNAQQFVDIEINEFANNWYIQIPQAGRTYIVEFGLLFKDGSTSIVVRSNTFSIPRIGVSPVADENWSTVSTDELIRLSASSSFVETTGSSENTIMLNDNRFTISFPGSSGTCG